MRTRGGWRLLAAALVLTGAGTAPLAAQHPAAAAVAPAAAKHAAAADSAAELLAAHLLEHALPGLSVAVGVEGDVVWSAGFGMADLEHRLPVTPLTRFRIGSVSKPLTAVAVGLLHQRGLLDLDSPVQRYVPSFPEKRWPVTTRQAAGHTAGIRHYRGDEFYAAEHYPTVADGLAIFAADSLEFRPGTAYSYSSYGWNLVSAVIEGAAGRPFLEVMNDEIIEPLGLRHTVAEHMDSIIPYRVRYYEHDEVGRLINAPYVDNSYKWAGGGYLSTPEDLVRFGFAHLDGGLLDERMVDLLWAPHTLESGESTGYGIGWRTYDPIAGTRALGHTGGSVGGTTAFLVLPDAGVVVAMVSNLSSAPGLLDLARRTAELFLPRE